MLTIGLNVRINNHIIIPALPAVIPMLHIYFIPVAHQPTQNQERKGAAPKGCSSGHSRHDSLLDVNLFKYMSVKK